MHTQGDVVLARRGSVVAQHAEGGGGRSAGPPIVARVVLWDSHEELADAVAALLDT